MKGLSISVFVLAILLTACAGTIYKLPPGSSLNEQEVLAAQLEFYKFFENLNCKGISEFYTENALIGYENPMDRFKFEVFKTEQFERYKSKGYRYRITIRKIETRPYGIVVKSEHRRIYIRGYRSDLRYFTWIKTDAGWRILRHSPWDPNGPDLEYSPLNDLADRKPSKAIDAK